MSLSPSLKMYNPLRKATYNKAVSSNLLYSQISAIHVFKLKTKSEAQSVNDISKPKVK